MASLEPLETVRVLPRRGSVTIKLLTLLWLPEVQA
jgi:hypothetical protein